METQIKVSHPFGLNSIGSESYPVCHGRIYPSILFADLCCKNSLWQHQPGSSAAL